ncbi:hypothetical protein Btru_018129 [Bulinus truncatus]|nr:hypothetical protein Btru_018129 [Bulinus truncatus]
MDSNSTNLLAISYMAHFKARNGSVGFVPETQPDDPVSAELLQLVELIFSCVLIHVFAILGLAGATVNIIVLSKFNITTDSSNILLISLSVADFVFCLTIPIWTSGLRESMLLLMTPLVIFIVFGESLRACCSVKQIGTEYF